MYLLWTSKRYFIIVAIETSFIKTGKTINKFVNLVYFYFFSPANDVLLSHMITFLNDKVRTTGKQQYGFYDGF